MSAAISSSVDINIALDFCLAVQHVTLGLVLIGQRILDGHCHLTRVPGTKCVLVPGSFALPQFRNRSFPEQQGKRSVFSIQNDVFHPFHGALIVNAWCDCWHTTWCA